MEAHIFGVEDRLKRKRRMKMESRLGPVLASAALLLLALVAVAMGEGDRAVQGYMYVESADLARFSALEDFALAHPRPARRSDFAASQTTREKKQQAMKLLPEMMSYMKHNTLSSDQVAEQIARMLADQPKFPSAKDQEKKVKANPFESTFARQFIDASGTKGVGPNTARQVKGNGRGGLIAIWGLEWAYGAHDVSQDTEQLAFNNRKRSLSSNYLGSLENGTA